MCFLETLTEDNVEPRCHRGQEWMLPDRILVALLGVSCLFILIGIILLAVGIGSVGGVFLGLGGCGLMILLLTCLHAYCCRYTREVYTQTGEGVSFDSTEIPTYAVIQKPSSLKRADSGSKRNGRIIEKHVTLSPDTEVHDFSGQVTVAPSVSPVRFESNHQVPVQNTQPHSFVQQSNMSQQYPIYKPSGQAYVPPAPMYHPSGSPYAAPSNQYPMQVYPLRTASSTSSSIRYGFDDDYDNPAESTPMMSHHSMSSAASSMQSHDRVMSSTQSQGRSTTANYTTTTREGGSSRGDPDIPEPQPLVYPSAKRPMTFEQTSSSKMSVYDNVLSAFPEEID